MTIFKTLFVSPLTSSHLSPLQALSFMRVASLKFLEIGSNFEEQKNKAID